MRKPMKEVEHIQCFRGLLDMLSFDECVTNLPISPMGCDLAHIFDGSLVQQWQFLLLNHFPWVLRHGPARHRRSPRRSRTRPMTRTTNDEVQIVPIAATSCGSDAHGDEDVHVIMVLQFFDHALS